MTAQSSSYYQVDPDRLREGRHFALFTREELAQKSGVSLETIERIERGQLYKMGQRGDTVRLLAEAMMVPPRWLLKENSWGNSTGNGTGNSQGQMGGNENRKATVTPIKPLEAFDLGLGLGTAQPLEPKAHASHGADTAPLDLKLQSPKVNGQPRPDQEMFALVAEVCGWSLDTLTPSARGRVNSAAKELRDVAATEDEVRLFAVLYGEHWPGIDLTPQSISGNWSAFKAGNLYTAARKGRR